MRNNFLLLFSVSFFLLITFNVSAQTIFFKDVAETAIQNNTQKRVIQPFKYRTIAIDSIALLRSLKTIPDEKTVINYNNITNNIIELPMPDGSSAKFNIWETSIMEPELAARYPEIKTYTGQGIDDKTATVKLDWTTAGFHAMILSPITTAVFIDNYAQGNKTNYISYYKSDFIKRSAFIETEVRRNNTSNTRERPAEILAKQCRGTQLRTYRLAVACTGEYARAATGLLSPSVAQTLSAIVTTVNRVNGVYEKEIDVRMILVASEDKIVYTTPSTDPFTGNTNGSILIDESQQVIDAEIGNANYDMGHTFSTGGGGISGLGIICETGSKASSITGSNSPVGDPYDIDYVAHEMGHALGAEHTFNSAAGACSGNGSKGTNAEPGSGSTIMAYAGICNNDDLQPHTDPQFHALSFDEITTYVFNNKGNTCGILTNTGNTPPVVNPGANFIIPKSTPFILTGSATDIDGDALTYSWEQVDVGGNYSTWNAPSGNAPLFRSFPPVTVPFRYFPKLSDVINNTTTKGEIMPSYARTLHFRLTARDNKAVGGGVCFGEMTTTVDANTGPFVVTYPSATGISWNSGESRTITWNTANTQASPVNCSNVNIQLSTDGGLTYPVTIVANTANDGTETITVPSNITTQARIRIMAVGNVFYDISNSNFSIVASSPTFYFAIPDTVKICTDNSGSGLLTTSSFADYITPVSLSASGNPQGSSVTFSNNTITPGDTVTVTLNNAETLPAEEYIITITGISGNITKTQTMIFSVGNMQNAVVLSSPLNRSIGVSTLPTFSWDAVPTAESYTLEISLSNTFSSITRSIAGITSTSHTLTTPLNETTVYYWRVKPINFCGAGIYSDTFLFKTITNNCTVFTSTNIPLSISSSGSPAVTSTLNIPNENGVTISDINVVGLTGTHTWVSELTFTLTSPAATNVILFDRICDNNNRYQNFNINLDDQAALATFPCPPTGNVTVVPSTLLSAFNGQQSAGTWTLTVKDNESGDGGSLTGWGIRVCSSTAEPLNLVYTFIGNGNWSDPVNWVNASVPPATAITGSQIIINPVTDGTCNLNIPYTLAPGSSLTVMQDKNFIIAGNLTIQN